HSADSSGNAGGAITNKRPSLAFNQLALRVEVDIARCGGRRHFAVINCRRLSSPEPNHHESAAAQITRGRMRHSQSKRNGYGGIDCVAATLHNVNSYLR